MYDVYETTETKPEQTSIEEKLKNCPNNFHRNVNKQKIKPECRQRQVFGVNKPSKKSRK